MARREHIALMGAGLYTSMYVIPYMEALMQPLKFDEDIRPLSEFRAGIASFVKQVSETRRPMVLTQHGRGVAVLVDIHEFEVMRTRLELLEDVTVAETQIAAGRLTPQDEAKARALERPSSCSSRLPLRASCRHACTRKCM